MRRFSTMGSVALGAWVLAALVGGCGSDNDGGRTAQGKQAVDSLRGTRQELAKARTEVQESNASLDKLAAGGNLQQTYQQFTRQVAEMKAAGERTRARGQDMRARTRQYVTAWEKEMDQISSPELRQGASQRRAKVKQSFDSIATAVRQLADAYRPYLQSLQEIQKALANDLTPAGVDSARLAIDKAKSQGETVLQRADEVLGLLDEVGGSMASGAAPQASGK